MPQEYSRAQRVADQIQKQLALLIQHEVKDPRIGMVTITGVKVSREFDHAVIYFSVLGQSIQGKTEEVESTLEGLQKAAGYLRTALAKKLKLRTTPKLKFSYDSTVEDGNRLSSLIDSAVAEQNPQNQELP